MTREGFSRRLLAALADSTPAFTPTQATESRSRSRRLLAALADSTPAFVAAGNADEYSSQPQPTTEGVTRPLALSRFVDSFLSQPPHERLTARIWFPRQELASLRSIAWLAGQLRLLASVLTSDHTRDRARELARVFDRELDHVRGLDLDGALHRDLDDARARARALARALDRDRYPARVLALVLARVLARVLIRALALARDRARDRAVDRALDHNPPADALARDLDRALDLMRALDLDRTVALDFDLALDLDGDLEIFTRELIAAIDRLNEAVTNVAGADLAQMDLHGIPLEGLRWSTTTRWPKQWQDAIWQNSIELGAGLYEIRYGGVAADRTVDISP